MQAYLPYLIKSSVILLVLSLYYRMFLKKQTFFNLNRFYLLVTLLLSVTFPFISIEINRNEMIPLPSLTYVNDFLETTPPGGISPSVPVSQGSSTLTILPFLYYLGTLFFFLRYLYRIGQLYRFVHCHPHKKWKKLHLVQLPEGQATFSFFNYLFIDMTSFSPENRRKIFAHEKIHIQQFHSVDLCIAEIMCILNWYNPLVWIVKQLILENHEYIADRQVVRKFQTGSYLQLLIQQTFQGTFSFTSHFSCSNLKKRTMMLTRRKSRRVRILTYLPTLLLTGMLFYLFACNNKISSQSEKETFVIVDHMPEFPGDIPSWIASRIQYPPQARQQNIQGKVFVNFVIDTLGKIDNVKILKGADPLLEKEALRIIKSMPAWSPGSHKGKKVRISQTLPIEFRLDEKLPATGNLSLNQQNMQKPADTLAARSEVFAVVEDMPRFTQGNPQEWLSKHINYPAEALEKKISGKVYVQFIIEKDGSITNVQIVRGVEASLDAEAIRVISSMPAWTSGRQRNHPVRVSYTLPVSFSLP